MSIRRRVRDLYPTRCGLAAWAEGPRSSPDAFFGRWRHWLLVIDGLWSAELLMNVHQSPTPCSPCSSWESRSLLSAVSAVVLCSVWMAVSLFLLSRRLTGAFDFPLPGVGLFLCAVGLIALTSVVRTLLVQIAWSPSVWMLGIVWLVPTAAMLMTAIAVSLPQTPFWTLFLFWGLLVCAELAWTTPNTQLGDWTTDWFRRFSETSGPRTNHLEKAGDPDRDTRSQPILAEPVPTDSLTSDSLTSDSEMADSEMADSEMSEPVQPMADDVIQQLVRTRDSRAEESLAGCVRVDVAAGQSTARSHIGFSPIFPGEPRVYVEPREQDNLSVTAMVAHVSTLGVRIDVRISPAADVDRIVWLDVFATWTPPDDQSKGAGDQGPAR